MQWEATYVQHLVIQLGTIRLYYMPELWASFYSSINLRELHHVQCTMVSTLGLYKRNPHLKSKSELRKLSRVL